MPFTFYTFYFDVKINNVVLLYSEIHWVLGLNRANMEKSQVENRMLGDHMLKSSTTRINKGP